LRKALLAVYTAGHFTELRRTAVLLRQSQRYAPAFLFSRWYYGDLDRDAAICEAEGIPWLTDALSTAELDRRSANQPSGAGAAVATRRGVVATVSKLPFPFTAVRAIARQARELYRARHIIKTERPDLVVLAEDGVAYETAALIKAAHEQGIPAVILPFTVCNALEPAETFFHNPAYSLERWSNRLVGSLYPRWVFAHRGRRLLRMPAAQVLAKEWWGLAPPLPWQMNSGAADAVAVESPFMEAYYRREGLPPEKLITTGTLADDVLAEARLNAAERRKEICAELGFASDRRLILCALPPDQFKISGSQADAPNYATLVQVWVQALAALPGCNIVVRLHPRMSYEAYKYIETWGVRISQHDTASLVPLCDLFVASVSATIRWAIACGKPVLNYDVYRLRWTDFDDAPGVLRVEDRQAFVETLRMLVTDEAFFNDVRARQQADASRWGRLDGCAHHRILECFDHLVKRPDSAV
jgi:hypothetical protein